MMVNRQVQFPEHQARWLRREARRLGCSASEVVRRAVQREMDARDRLQRPSPPPTRR